MCLPDRRTSLQDMHIGEAWQSLYAIHKEPLYLIPTAERSLTDDKNVSIDSLLVWALNARLHEKA